MADRLREMNLGADIRIQHFGNLRGSNAYEDCDVAFITGRNQPPQYAVDGLARALWWKEEVPLQHDEAARLGVNIQQNLPLERRGYVMTDPEGAAGVDVRSFSDGRIEAVHQQLREAETTQAIARLRLVHSPRIKHVFLLSNLPVEMPVDRLVSWDQVHPDDAERELVKTGSYPLSPRSMQVMRPDLASSPSMAMDRIRRTRARDPSQLLSTTPVLSRLMMAKVNFRQTRNGMARGVTHSHLFLVDHTLHTDSKVSGALGRLPVDAWRRQLEHGDPAIPASGWGAIQIVGIEMLEPPPGWTRLNHGSDVPELG